MLLIFVDNNTSNTIIMKKQNHNQAKSIIYNVLAGIQNNSIIIHNDPDHGQIPFWKRPDISLKDFK